MTKRREWNGRHLQADAHPSGSRHPRSKRRAAPALPPGSRRPAAASVAVGRRPCGSVRVRRIQPGAEVPAGSPWPPRPSRRQPPPRPPVGGAKGSAFIARPEDTRLHLRPYRPFPLLKASSPNGPFALKTYLVTSPCQRRCRAHLLRL